jgi:hypothetical protein
VTQHVLTNEALGTPDGTVGCVHTERASHSAWRDDVITRNHLVVFTPEASLHATRLALSQAKLLLTGSVGFPLACFALKGGVNYQVGV